MFVGWAETAPSSKPNIAGSEQDPLGFAALNPTYGRSHGALMFVGWAETALSSKPNMAGSEQGPLGFAALNPTYAQSSADRI